MHLVMPAVAVDLPGRGGHAREITALMLDDAVQAVICSADHAGFEQPACLTNLADPPTFRHQL